MVQYLCVQRERKHKESTLNKSTQSLDNSKEIGTAITFDTTKRGAGGTKGKGGKIAT